MLYNCMYLLSLKHIFFVKEIFLILDLHQKFSKNLLKKLLPQISFLSVLILYSKILHKF